MKKKDSIFVKANNRQLISIYLAPIALFLVFSSMCMATDIFTIDPCLVTATASSEYVPGTTAALDTINRSGMSVYGGNDVHNWVYTDMWLSTAGGLGSQPWIKWQFDQVYSIDTMSVWNYNQGGYAMRGMRHTTIEYSLDGTSWTTLSADCNLAKAPGDNNYVCNNSIDFGGVAAKYVRFTVHPITTGSDSGNWGATDGKTGLSEVEFEAYNRNIVTLQPDQVTASASQYDSYHIPASVVNRSGLTTTYPTHTHDSTHSHMWLSEVDGVHTITFEFDNVYSMHKMKVWNYNQPYYTTRGIRHTTIEYSTNGSSWSTLYADYEIDKASGSNGVPYTEAISLNSVSAKYIKITPHALTGGSDSGNWGYTAQNHVGLAEVEFEISRPRIYAFCGVGDHLWVAEKEPVDSPNTIEAMFEWMADTYNINRMYWRDCAIWDANFSFGEETQWQYDYSKWEDHVYNDLNINTAAVAAAKSHGMENWLYAGLYEAGVQPDVGIIGRPYLFEDELRITDPNKCPLNRWLERRQPGMLPFCYPDIRAAVINRLINHMIDCGYDGINFYTYVENTGIRYEDEFGFEQPIVDEFNITYPDVNPRTDTLTQAQKDAWYESKGKFTTDFLSELKTELNEHLMKLSIILDSVEPNYPQPTWGQTIRGTGKIYMDWEKWIDDGIVDEIWVQLADTNTQKALLDRLLVKCAGKPVKLSVRTTDPLDSTWDSYVAQGVTPIAVITWENNNGIEKYSSEQATASTLNSSDWKLRLQTLTDIANDDLSAPAANVAPLVSDSHVLVRRMAVKALAALGDTNEVSAIEEALSDSESSVRMAAAASLELSGPNSVSDIFSALEQDEYFQFKNACVNTLGVIASVSDVNNRMNSTSQTVREVCVRTLYCLGKTPADTNDAYTILRNRTIDIEETNEVRYWALFGQIGLITWFNDTQKSQLITDLTAIIADANEPPIVQLEAINGLVYMKNYMSSSQITNTVNDLKEIFTTYGDGCTRNDAAYGWRVVGNTLIALGAEGTKALSLIMDTEVNSVTATASSESYHMASLCVNGSGLSYGKHTWNHLDMWLSEDANVHWLKFEFDGTYKLEKMQFWNYNQATPYNKRGIRHATIDYSTNGTNWTTLDSDYEFSKAPGLNNYEHADDVWFNGVSAKYVKITPHAIDPNDPDNPNSGSWGYGNKQVGVSEVIFNIDPDDPNYPTDSWLPWLAYQVLYEKQQTQTQDSNGLNLVTEANDIRDHGRYSPSSFPGYRSW